jgi:DNA-directed RNA polymerase subunit RPC12/RpoP
MKIYFNKKQKTSADRYDYKYDNFDPDEEIECPYCGAHYKKDLIKCPYCASTNPIGSEKAYMDKLTGMKDTMAELKKEDKNAAREESKEIWHMVRPLIIIAVIIVVIIVTVAVRHKIKETRRTNEYLEWSSSTLPRLEEMYENKQYGKILKIYEKESLKTDAPIFTWEHSRFFEVLNDIKNEHKYFDPENKKLWSRDTYRVYLEEYCIIKYLDYDTRLTKDEISYIKNKYSDYEKELSAIYPFTEEEDRQFMNSYREKNYIDSKYIESYLKNYYKVNNIKKGDQ